VRIPVWLTLGIAAVVIIFGAYRVYLAMRPVDENAAPRRGLYSMSKRAHLVVGIIYLLLGAGLVSTSFGFNPFGGPAAGDDPAPSKPNPIPIEQTPQR
jgi:hypothetical protein